jgi:imidazolonepropionase-like amidohydrolase
MFMPTCPLPTRSSLVIAILAVWPVIAAAQAPELSLASLPSAPKRVAIVDVSVVPMDRERILAHQTVVVEGGRIVAMGPAAATRIPSDAMRVRGQGKFLAPGLVDMHAHFAPGTESLNDGAGRQLALYLATGFTTVRGLGGAPTALALRDRIRRGELVGPRLVVASPSINGRSVHSPAEAAARVREAKAAGFDLIKTHGMFPTGESYDSLVAAARAAQLPLSGHVTPEYGLRRAMDAGQQIEHLDGFIAEVVADGAPAPDGGQMILDPAVLTRIDTAKVTALAREVARRHLWNGPTLALFRTVMSDEPPESLLTRPELRYVPAAGVRPFVEEKRKILAGTPPEGRHLFLAARDQLVKALWLAGARLLVGSDSPQFFMVPGYSAYREIDAFAEAGLSPYAALEAATRNPAEYLGVASDVGTVAVGKRADLVLLAKNPLESTRNLRSLDGVMVAGRWIDRGTLDQMLAAVATHAAAVRP